MSSGGHRWGFGGLSDTKHSPPQLTVPTESEETTRWWQTEKHTKGWDRLV